MSVLYFLSYLIFKNKSTTSFLPIISGVKFINLGIQNKKIIKMKSMKVKELKIDDFEEYKLSATNYIIGGTGGDDDPGPGDDDDDDDEGSTIIIFGIPISLPKKKI